MAKKVSLRQFQEGVVARLKEAQSGAANQSASKMGVQVGREKWLVNLPDVSEVVPLPSLLPVPLTQRWFAEPTQTNIDSRLLLANSKYHLNAGIIVHHMLGLKQPEQLQAGDASNLPPWIVAEYLDAEGNIWKELNMSGLINHPDFLNVGA
jgi:twitching motility protein PilI